MKLKKFAKSNLDSVNNLNDHPDREYTQVSGNV